MSEHTTAVATAKSIRSARPGARADGPANDNANACLHQTAGLRAVQSGISISGPDELSRPVQNLHPAEFVSSIPTLELRSARVSAIDQPTGERPFYCLYIEVDPPRCSEDGSDHRLNGKRTHRIIGTPFGRHTVILYVTEWRCRCGARTALRWINPNYKNFTVDAFENALIGGVRRGFATVARTLNIGERTMRRLCLPTIVRLAETYRPIAPEFLAIDEIHVNDRRKSRRSRILFADAKGPPSTRLIDLGFSDTNEELRRMLRSLQNRERIVAVAMDGCERYADVVREELGHCIPIVYDRFHFQRDVLGIVVIEWRRWHTENARKREPEYRAALQVDRDLLRTRGGLSVAQEEALQALFRVVPQLKPLYQWAERQLRFYAMRDSTEALAVLRSARDFGLKLLADKDSQLATETREQLAALLRRIKRRQGDLLNYVRFRLPPPTSSQAKGSTVGFGTGTAESYNRRIDDLNRDGRGLHPQVLRIRALANSGPLKDEVILAAQAETTTSLTAYCTSLREVVIDPPSKSLLPARHGRRDAVRSQYELVI